MGTERPQSQGLPNRSNSRTGRRLSNCRCHCISRWLAYPRRRPAAAEHCLGRLPEKSDRASLAAELHVPLPAGAASGALHPQLLHFGGVVHHSSPQAVRSTASNLVE